MDLNAIQFQNIPYSNWNNVKIGIAQLNSTDNLQQNLLQIKNLVLDVKAEKPDLIVFPENALYFRIDQSEKVEAIGLDHEIMTELKEVCAATGIKIHFTTAVLEDGRVFNASVLIDSERNARVVYKKIHLFDIELSGQEPIRESDVFVHGQLPAVFKSDGFAIGSSICYDIRFSELYSVYAKAEVDVILVPAAFLVKTGQAHWEVLLRARAIESQCYVIAAAQSGVHRSTKSSQSRETYGHSMIIDPWGEVKAANATGVGIIFADLSRKFIEEVRKQIPMRSHRRFDL